MRYTNLNDELYVDGVALSSITGIAVAEYPFFGPGTRRGSNDTIPGRVGQVATYKPLDSYSFSIPIGVMGCTATGLFPGSLKEQRANMLSNLGYTTRVLSANGGKVRLTRRLESTGATGYVDQEADGEFVAGTALSLFAPEAGKTELEFINHSGCWYSDTYTTEHPGTFTVAGDYETRNLLISLPSAGILTNTTNGVWVQVSVACTLDVHTFGASAGLATLKHQGDYVWFVLAPGSNTVTWTGSGTPDIGYKAAYV